MPDDQAQPRRARGQLVLFALIGAVLALAAALAIEEFLAPPLPGADPRALPPGAIPVALATAAVIVGVRGWPSLSLLEGNLPVPTLGAEYHQVLQFGLVAVGLGAGVLIETFLARAGVTARWLLPACSVGLALLGSVAARPIARWVGLGASRPDRS